LGQSAVKWVVSLNSKQPLLGEKSARSRFEAKIRTTNTARKIGSAPGSSTRQNKMQKQKFQSASEQDSHTPMEVTILPLSYDY
jgi:hypothetical protein